MLATITAYNVGKFIHVLAVVLAFGPTFGYGFFIGLADTRAPAAVPAANRAVRLTNLFLVTPAMIVVLAAGFYLLAEGDVSMGESWVTVGLVAIIILFGLIHGFFNPRTRRAIELAERDLAAGGELSPEYRRISSQMARVGQLAGLIVAYKVLTKSAEKLNKAVNSELAPLKLERARFMTQIESDPKSPGPQGIDRVEFWVQTNPGTKPGPLMKVASGGELSRFLLALKVVLSDRGSAPTLVFDEIDTGVGGALADAIGARLARLATQVQVMAVTHAPQVAARANQHLLISKDALDKGKRVATRVNALAADHRREDIARMLAGAEITAEARAAAERLLRAAS